MNQGERALEVRIVQIGIVSGQLIREEHALVDHRSTGRRDRVINRGIAPAPLIEQAGNRLAQNVNAALEVVL